MSKSKKNVFFNIYFGLISVSSFIGLCISIIVFAYNIISNKIITDEEYFSQDYWSLERCEHKWEIYNPKTEKYERTEISDESKNKCIEEEKKKLLLKRSIDNKETILLSWLRMVILLIVFPIHFTYFRKINK